MNYKQLYTDLLDEFDDLKSDYEGNKAHLEGVYSDKAKLIDENAKLKRQLAGLLTFRDTIIQLANDQSTTNS